jgi:hypothetical protein
MNIFNRIFKRLQREIDLKYNRIQIWRIIRSIPDELTANDKSPVIFFNSSTRLSGLSQNAGFSLITSLALRKNKIPVYHFVCNRGLRPCVLGTDKKEFSKEPPCRECMRTSRIIFGKTNIHPFSFKVNEEINRETDNLGLDELISYVYHDIPLGKLVLPSMRWILRRHHLADTKENRFLAQSYIKSAWGVYSEFSKLIDSTQPQAVIVFNGMFYPEAMARLSAQHKEVPVFSHEIGMLPFSVFFTDKEATAYPVDVDNKFRLSKDQEVRLDNYLANRFEGKFQTAGVRFWPEMRHFSKEFLEEIKKYSAMIPVFTNVIFDTSQSHANTIFKHMFAWLNLVIEEVKLHPEILFVIRAHPDEVRPGKESRESVSEWVAMNYIKEIPNIIFIPPDEYISSYELIKHAKFVMVYNSTVGLESSIMGKPVLCAGKARYTQVPTVYFPESKEAYKKLLKDFIEAETVEHPGILVENARRVLYSQLFRASLPFDQFLEDDGVWRGYVRLKKFSPELLIRGQSETVDVVLNGIIKNQSFIRDI